MPMTRSRTRRFAVAGAVVALAAGTATAATAETRSDGTVGPPHHRTTYDPSRGCDGSGPTVATGWCSQYDGATAGRAGRPVVLSTSVCRLPGLPTATLITEDGEQADFSVSRSAYPPSWSWSHHRSFSPDASWVTVPAGSCVTWSVRWAVVDNRGRPLPRGTYGISATPYMHERGAIAGVFVDNVEQFTVR